MLNQVQHDGAAADLARFCRGGIEIRPIEQLERL